MGLEMGRPPCDMRDGGDWGGRAERGWGWILKASWLIGVLKGWLAGCWLKGWKTKNLLF